MTQENSFRITYRSRPPTVGAITSQEYRADPFVDATAHFKQDATLSQGVPRDAAVNFGATGIIDIKKPMDRHITAGNASSKVH